MEDSRRQAYLQAMGIDAYVLRAALPGALESPTRAALPNEARQAAQVRRQLEVGNDSGQQGTPRKAADDIESRIESPAYPRGEAQAESLNKPLNKALKETQRLAPSRSPTDASSDDEPDPTAPRPAATLDVGESVSDAPHSSATADNEAPISQESGHGETLRISLRYFRVNPRLAILVEVPWLNSQQRDASRSALLQAILLSLEVEASDLMRPDRFDWPLNPDSDAPSDGMDAALQTLEGFLRKRLCGSEAGYLLVFGEQCESLFERGGFVAIPQLTEHLEVLHTSSLDAMLRVPALKRGVWRDIQSLRGRLSP